MHRRASLIAVIAASMLLGAGLAAIAADPAPAPPPRIAFLANGRNPADALATGPVAGQLGAPIFTTEPGSLPEGVAAALAAYSPALVVVMGGPGAIADDVVAAAASATGLPVVTADPDGPAPTTGIIRAAGPDRFATAALAAGLLEAYSPAYLPVDRQAVDAGLLGGQPASAFASADHTHDDIDAATLGGQPASAYALASDIPAVPAPRLVTRTYVCSGSGMTPFTSTQEWATSGNSFVFRGISTDGRATCALHLPDGATITEVRAELVDSHTNGRISNVSLQRQIGNSSSVIVGLDNPGGAANAATPGAYTATFDVDNHEIDNANATYVVRVRQSTAADADFDLQVRRVVVTYDVVDWPRPGE